METEAQKVKKMKVGNITSLKSQRVFASPNPLLGRIMRVMVFHKHAQHQSEIEIKLVTGGNQEKLGSFGLSYGRGVC